ncbi:HAMP domain-containing protein [Malonomonas rubra DSM 5091]|uniref:histidine kinase n=1 Tax=Malonomonas rubra DSM 5091 TaxID=1122189 RepID=A0A1M6JA97_MALRU|nr:HAMP domain-containing histidine kinase [Malonomonas rubra]SHJ43554.1 HAMP domain-containing protein [Malonomonas rubra DSM 5091]
MNDTQGIKTASPAINKAPRPVEHLTIRRGLSLAFGVLLGLTLLICLLAWLSYDELGSDMEQMSTELIPRVAKSRNLAMASNSLAGLAGKMAQARSREELERQAQFGLLASERLQQVLEEASGFLDPGQFQILTQINRQIADALGRLSLAVKRHLDLLVEQEKKRQGFRQALITATGGVEKEILQLAAEGDPQKLQLMHNLMALMLEAERMVSRAGYGKSLREIDLLLGEARKINTTRKRLFSQIDALSLNNPLRQALHEYGWQPGSFLTLQAEMLEIRGEVDSLVAASSQLSAQFRLLTTVIVKDSGEQIERVRQVALEKIDGRKRDMVVVVFSTLAIAALFVWYFGHRRMARPLVMLSEAVQAFEQGREDVIPPQTGVQEIQELSMIFERMSERIGHRDRELQHLHMLLRNVIDSLDSALLAVDQNCTLQLWNLRAKQWFDAEKLRFGCAAIAALDWLPIEMEQVKQAVAKGDHLLLKNIQAERDGEQQVFELSCNPSIDTLSPGAVLRLEEVTERLRLEKAIAQSEKILSVGSLAAGVAHEINNPLAGIMQNTQVLKNRLSSSLPRNQKVAEECGFQFSALESYLEERGIQKVLGSILAGADQTAQIVKKLQMFGRGSSGLAELSLERADIAVLLEDTLSLMSSDYDLRHGYDFRKIAITRNFATPLPQIYCDPALIQQALFNILKNCAQMLGQEDPPKVDACIAIDLQQDGSQLKLSIADNGPGMAEAVRQRIFEPFFSTRDVGLGAGLGMSVVYFIINDFHRGSIEVDSEPGKGCRFDIWLPLEQPATKTAR